MTNQADSPATRKWTPPDGQARVDVNLDEKDASKAIARVEGQNDLPAQEDADSDPETRFLNRSRAVKKRIQRIQRQFDQRIAERDAEHQREIAALNARFDGLQVKKTDTAPDEAAHERMIQALQSDLEKAHEEGNSKKVAEITSRINRAEAEYWHKKTVAQLGQVEKPVTKSAPVVRAPPKEEGGPTGEAKRWMKANTDWWDDPDFVGEKAYANALHAQMVEDEDSDPDSAEHFAELSKRLKKKFKELDIVDPSRKKGRKEAEIDDDEDGDLEANARAARPPVMQVDRGTQGVRRGRTQTLTATDVENMKKFGLDPSNDKHVLTYAKEKQATEAAGA